MAENTVRQVNDLTIGHVGQWITVEDRNGSASGRLFAIDARTEVGDLGTVGEADATGRDLISGRTTVTLTIGRSTLQIRRDATASVLLS